jgi:UTP--glucose-1-phosphate uridylyltransferase
MTIRKAIIVAAGYGTRFLPITKAVPKEMLPVIDKPVIQYVVEDAIAAGIKDIIFVTSSQKKVLEDHFDYNFELDAALEKAGKHELLKVSQDVAKMANFIYVRQKHPTNAKGTIVGILSGYTAIGDEPFLAMWGDDFILSEPNRATQLVQAYEKYQAPILGAIETDNPADTKLYGFAAGEEVEPGVIKVDKIVEKPGPGNAPSNYATVSGFVFTPLWAEYAQKTPPAANGEYQYTEAIDLMIKDGHPVYALKIKNARPYYDCGNKLNYMKTNIALGLDHPEIGPQLRDYMKEVLAKDLK